LDELADDDFDPAEAFPTLRPNKADARGKWKKSAQIGLEEITTFKEQLVDVVEMINQLTVRMDPIYMEPKRRLVAKIKELQQKAAEQECRRPVTSGRTGPKLSGVFSDLRSLRRAQNDAVRHQALPHQPPQGDQKLARQGHDGRSRCGLETCVYRKLHPS
jgi:hypothetical protein